MDLATVQKYYVIANNELEHFRELMDKAYLNITGFKNYSYSQMPQIAEDEKLFVYNVEPNFMLKKLVNILISLLMPPGINFADIAAYPDDNKKLNDWKDDTLVPQVFKYINNSNFYQILPGCLFNLTISTGGYYMCWKNDSIYFEALDMSKVSFLQDDAGRISYVFRKLGIFNKEKQILKFPHLADKFRESVTLLESIVPDGDQYIYRLTDEGFENVYEEIVQPINPFVIFRWDVRPTENRGRGIALDLLPEICQVNDMARQFEQAIDLAIMPPMVSNADLDNVILTPRKILKLANGETITPLNTGINLPFSYETIAQRNAAMSKNLYIDELEQIGQNGQLTATEVNARMQIANRNFVGYTSRNQSELLGPTLTNVIHFLIQYKVVDDPAIKFPNSKIKYGFKYNSPSLKAQGYQEIERVVQYTQTIGQIFGPVGQAAINSSMNIGQLPEFIGERLSIPSNLLRTAEQFTTDMLKIQQQQLDAANQAANQGSQQAGLLQ